MISDYSGFLNCPLMLNASVKRQPDPPLWPGPFYFVQQDSLFYIHFVFISTSSKRWYMKTLFRRSQTDFFSFTH